MLSRDDKKRIAEEERHRDEVRGKIKRGEPLDDDQAKAAANTKNTVSIVLWGFILLLVIGRCVLM